MKFFIISTLLVAASMAALEFKTTTKDKGATPNRPICTFDPVKGEYICLEGADILERLGSASFGVATVENTVDVPSFQVDATTKVAISPSAAAGAGARADTGPNTLAADCGKCQVD